MFDARHQTIKFWFPFHCLSFLTISSFKMTSTSKFCRILCQMTHKFFDQSRNAFQFLFPTIISSFSQLTSAWLLRAFGSIFSEVGEGFLEYSRSKHLKGSASFLKDVLYIINHFSEPSTTLNLQSTFSSSSGFLPELSDVYTFSRQLFEQIFYHLFACLHFCATITLQQLHCDLTPF